MPVSEFDSERWPAELHALAQAESRALDAVIDNLEDKDLLGRFDQAATRFRDAHHSWLSQHPERIPALIAHRRREQHLRRPYARLDHRAEAKLRESEQTAIEELWQLYDQAIGEADDKQVADSAPIGGTSGATRFTIDVTVIRHGLTPVSFGLFDSAEDAGAIASQWRSEVLDAGVPDAFVDVSEIHDVTSYPAWIAPELRRAREEQWRRARAGQWLSLLLDFHDGQAIDELGPQRIAETISRNGAFDVTVPEEAVDGYRRAARAAADLLGTALATSARQESQGVNLRIVVKTTIDLNAYRAEHGTNPRGRGVWILRNERTGDEFRSSGAWGDARAAVPGGDWILLP